MKILVCHNYYQSKSGEDIVIETDLEILRNHGIEVLQYSRSNKELQSMGLIRSICLIGTIIYSFKTVRDLEKIIATEKPDLALVQNVFPLISPSVYYLLKRRNIPIIQLVYNYRLICPNAILYTKGAICEKWIKGNFLHAFANRCFRNSFFFSGLYALTIAIHRHIGKLSQRIDAFITPDFFLKNKLMEGGFSGDKIFKILNPFNIEHYSPQYDEGKYFIYFGRIVKEKGIFTLLKAMAVLTQIKLIVVGSGEAELSARKLVEERSMQNVSFVGPKYGKELIDFLNASIGVIVPTEWFDNSPLVIHQAFALGKPVIASRIDGIPEIVEDGKEGLLFEAGNASDLIDKIQFLYNSKELQNIFAKNARTKAEEYFTAEHRFRELKKVFAFACTQKNDKILSQH